MLLDNPDFDIDQEFLLVRSQKTREMFSTPYTLLDLEYETIDVVERIKELTVREYSETLIDKDNTEPPLLYVFGKEINDRLVYIKLKIKEAQKKYVLCVSFHYAEKEMRFPYI